MIDFEEGQELLLDCSQARRPCIAILSIGTLYEELSQARCLSILDKLYQLSQSPNLILAHRIEVKPLQMTASDGHVPDLVKDDGAAGCLLMREYTNEISGQRF